MQSMNSSWVLDQHKMKPAPKDIFGLIKENLYEPESANIREWLFHLVGVIMLL